MREKERVILGLPGPWAGDYREASDHYTTKIGGLPDWSTPSSINTAQVSCRLCGEKLYLLAQVYSPISMEDSKIEDRTIYILVCPRPNCAGCSGGWRALRVQKGPSQSQSGSEKQVGSKDYSDGGNPILKERTFRGRTSQSQSDELAFNDWWASGDASDDDVDMMSLSQAISQAYTKKQNLTASPDVLPKINPRPVDSDLPVLPCFYLYDEEEKFFDDRYNIHKQCSSLSIQDTSDDSSNEERWEAESYEYDRALGVDRTYLKFKKRLEAYPEQCIRYCHGGIPLVAEKLSEEPICCQNCGAERSFEMQLMPPLLFFLQQAATDESTLLSLNHWHWMTAIIYTCSKNCSFEQLEDVSDGREFWTVAEESIVIQWE